MSERLPRGAGGGGGAVRVWSYIEDRIGATVQQLYVRIECSRLNVCTYVRMDRRMDGREEDEDRDEDGEECTDIFRALQISAYDWRVGPSRRRGPGSFGGRPAARLPLVGSNNALHPRRQVSKQASR